MQLSSFLRAWDWLCTNSKHWHGQSWSQELVAFFRWKHIISIDYAYFRFWVVHDFCFTFIELPHSYSALSSALLSYISRLKSIICFIITYWYSCEVYLSCSSQSRADLLTLGLAVTNILTGLVWLSIRPKSVSVVRASHLLFQPQFFSHLADCFSRCVFQYLPV